MVGRRITIEEIDNTDIGQYITILRKGIEGTYNILVIKKIFSGADMVANNKYVIDDFSIIHVSIPYMTKYDNKKDLIESIKEYCQGIKIYSSYKKTDQLLLISALIKKYNIES